jgi:epsilon-lactone hydrolase
MNSLRRVARSFVAFGIAIIVPLTVAAQTTMPVLEVPARTVPVPTTVSPEMQKIIGAPFSSTWRLDPQNAEEWKAAVNSAAVAGAKNAAARRELLHVRMEAINLGDVKAFALTPETIREENRNRLLVHIHGGCYVFSPGEAGTSEAITMASLGGIKVISIDYRMPPDHPYPAALDDVMAGYKALIATTSPKRMAVFGTSAGGALALSMALRAKSDGVGLPAAIGSGTPMSDLTNAGDTFQTNAMLDNILVAPGAMCDKAAALYANGRNLADPMLSPVNGDMKGLPPTILTSGTRDLLLSSTVRVHRKLRQAGVEAVLHVYEGQAHAHYVRDPNAPETKEAFDELARFFDKHLEK